MSPSVRLGKKFEDALSLALEVHGGDTRKGKDTPYVSHLLGVASLVLMDGGSEDEAIAGLLHDTLEDHPEEVTKEQLAERFGGTVSEIVVSCTDTEPGYSGGPKAPWRERKERYVAHLAHASVGARRVALADKLYNARDLLADVRREGAKTWNRFTAGPADQIRYLREVQKSMHVAGKTGVLMEEFERVLDDLAEFAEDGARR
ncbi:MAG: HD domain-containing protein [Candidatus Eisenbacteria bacterium]|uniref:HD domain-containing protein n=1 Tax=Eiseniibacteriota bacterium TaxID=2212470 RepID=A0A933S9X2_UNCEI|nr:HD domain-containing protein [Candidatus Eisenbacteria bacterium]